MKIGFVGLGKLGYPVATALAHAGHDVIGHDVDPAAMTFEPRPYVEAGPDGTGDFNEHVVNMGKYGRDGPTTMRIEDLGSLKFGTLAETIAHAEIIFVAVQTPHAPEYEGITPLPDERADFDYSFLVASCREIEAMIQHNRLAIKEHWCEPIVAIISTVLPGTMRREILPIFEGVAPVVYNPSFIAMGTVWRDFVDPEFVLMGSDDEAVMLALMKVYKPVLKEKMREGSALMWQAPLAKLSIESAELVKVAYNTFIGFKVAFANVLGEICDRIGPADVDAVTDTLSLATRRLWDPRSYTRAGMGDGGGCHPRDNIAMSWLAQKNRLYHDLFENLMLCRERHATNLVYRMLGASRQNGNLPLAILGTAFKADVAIETGSHALLVEAILVRAGHTVEMIADPKKDWLSEIDCLEPRVFLIGCNHSWIPNFAFPEGSVVIDPWRIVPDRPGVHVHRIGEAR